MSKIESLTEEQKALFPKYVEKWLHMAWKLYVDIFGKNP